MGVPAFYRWLSEKYPKIILDVLEDRVHLSGGTTGGVPIPFDSTRPNPTGLECDNLYIDMNGIIHPCSHPENGPQPKTEEEMYENVCLYVDRLFRVMRPRQLLYLAIDGVAPRAKMNQQRSRRFRSGQEARELKELEENVRSEMELGGQKLPPVKDAWDSNVITPGTPFMLRLAEYIRFYIRKRIATDKAWRTIRVIFSDASLPGEGEHKIMSHVRLQRACPGYNPNTVHILHGLDADLIMLALATHEAHFYISREEVMFGRKSQEEQEKRQLENGFRDSQRALDEAAGGEAMQLLENCNKPLQIVSIPVLREYLAAEFHNCVTPGKLPFAPSLERLIDDIVFLCFFVGNDFLPHLPSLDIRDGALDYLFNVYKRLLPGLGDYITKSGGNVNLSHVDVILAEVGAIEDYVFAMKYENEQKQEERRRQMKERNKKRGNQRDAPPLVRNQEQHKVKGRAAKILEKQEQEEIALKRGHQAKEDARHNLKARTMVEEDNEKAALALKQSLGHVAVKKEESDLAVKKEEEEEEEDLFAVKEEDEESVKKEESGMPVKKEEEDVDMGVKQEDVKGSGTKRKLEEAEAPVKREPGVVGDAEEEFEDDANDEDDTKVVVVDPQAAAAFKEKVKARQQKQLDDFAKDVDDKVRLHEKGWKDRYYTDKCKAEDVSAYGGKEHLFRSYVMGLCWVMKYYYDGCVSWKWYYPFHYGPFASDLKNIERFSKDCKSFELATPFNPVEQLMAVLPSDSAHTIPKASRWIMCDQESPIIDLYPKEVPVDPNGKAMPWLWVVLLPFIEEDRLLSVMSPTMAKWTKEELLCNARGLDDGYLYVHRANPLAKKLEQILEGGKTAKEPKVRLTDSASYGCAGFSGSLRPPLSNEIYPIDEDSAVPPPSTAGKITTRGSIFAESIEPNDTLCVAFTEPPKLSHKSVLLPGAKLLPAILGNDDKRIRRPRLNRGGGTIANMGMSNGQSHQSGYGSMNMGRGERDLAERTGRGREMYQPGTRAWGAMEPTPKRFQAGVPPPPQMQNPFMGQGRGPPPQQAGYNGPPWQNQNQGQRGPPNQPQQQGYQQQQGGRPSGYQNGGGYQQQQGGYQQQQGGHQQQQGGRQQQQQQQGGQQQQQGGYQQQQGGYQRQQQGGGGQRPSYNNNNRQQPPPYQQAPQQGFNFRSHTQQPSGPPQQHGQGNGQPRQNQPPPGANANSNVMSSLRAQLASTLQQNKRPGGPK
jgi:5'-3' exoribonuclease 2